MNGTKPTKWSAFCALDGCRDYTYLENGVETFEKCCVTDKCNNFQKILNDFELRNATTQMMTTVSKTSTSVISTVTSTSTSTITTSTSTISTSSTSKNSTNLAQRNSALFLKINLKFSMVIVLTQILIF